MPVVTGNVEILHRAQMGQDVYIYGIRTYQTYIHIYIDNFPFSPQLGECSALWGEREGVVWCIIVFHSTSLT